MGHQGCIGGLAGSVGTQGPEGFRWHKGELWAPRGCRGVGGHKRGITGVRGVLGAGRECRYSGA